MVFWSRHTDPDQRFGGSGCRALGDKMGASLGKMIDRRHLEFVGEGLLGAAGRYIDRVEPMAVNPRRPVSYTHLDVYKRQPIICI